MEILGQTKITRGGQITLSKKAREKLGIKEGDYVILIKDGNAILIKPAELKVKI
jgi:AbrB family looped-hinge helix DNA binding protein